MKTKGLEPIVAAVLLIVVAVIGAVLVYLWFAGFVTKATSQAEQASASEKLKIEAATLDSATPRVILYVRNLGGADVRIVSTYVLIPGSLTPVCYKDVNPAETIYANSLGYLDINLAGTCTLTAGREYVVKLVTAKGTEFAVTVTAS